MGMKELAYTEATFDGGCRVEVKLEPVPNPHGFAADIAVVESEVATEGVDVGRSCAVGIEEVVSCSHEEDGAVLFCTEINRVVGADEVDDVRYDVRLRIEDGHA